MGCVGGSSENEDEQPVVMRNDNDNSENENELKKNNCELVFCKKEYPKSVFLIIGNEFCERFCYYGMRAVLQTYLALQLKLSFDVAGTLFHAFAMVSYFTPLLGAVLADSFIGRYWTIVILSAIYVFGNIIMASTSVGGGYLAGALTGMFIIAIGTGGIKPCVSAFGADQFPPSMAIARESFFSLFYVAINAGALLSQFITPEVKSFSCFGYDSCWVLAFGLPAILMGVALILFLIGTPFYYRAPVEGGVALTMFKAVWLAFVRTLKGSKHCVDHWLDRAVGPTISQAFVDDLKAVFKVLVLFLPLPFFWALFDQQGSRWTYQAQKMDSYIENIDWTIQAEQIQIFNCLIVLTFVPVFQAIVYPLFAKWNFLVRPLQRMVAGCFLAALSFVIIGGIQVAIQNQADILVKGDYSTYRVRAYNFHSTCSFTLISQDENGGINLQPSETSLFSAKNFAAKNLLIIPDDSCSRTCSNQTVYFDKASLSPISALTISNDCTAVLATNGHSFPDDVEYLFQIQISSFTPDPKISHLSVVDNGGQVVGGSFTSNGHSYVQLNYSTIVKPGHYKLKIQSTNGSTSISEAFILRQGGAYTFAYGLNSSSTELLVDKKPNAVSVFWQLIPYLVVTWGEIMFSITGLSFAFSQAPASMKSLLQAAWLLTVSFGNIIDIIIINIQIADKAVEFFVFALLMFIVTLIFGIMSCFYKYVDDVYGDRKRRLSDSSRDVSTALSSEIAPPLIEKESEYGSFKTAAAASNEQDNEQDDTTPLESTDKL